MNNNLKTYQGKIVNNVHTQKIAVYDLFEGKRFKKPGRKS